MSHTADSTAKLLGYVDDLSLVSHSKQSFISNATTLTELLHLAKFELGIDQHGKSKTAAMTNCTQLSQLSLTVNTEHTPITYNVPILRNDETYKYLGMLININLTWNDQIKAVNNKVCYHAQLLRRKCFPAAQTVRIINQVIIPSVTTKLSIASAPLEDLKKWEKILAAVVNLKLGMCGGESPKYLYLPGKAGGLGLHKLNTELRPQNSTPGYTVAS